MKHPEHEIFRSDVLYVESPPWDYNSGAWSQRIPICVLALVGFLISAYMGLYQWRLIDSAWDPVFGEQTEKVLDSNVSEKMRSWFLVPDAIFGALAYLGDAIFGVAGSTRRWQTRPWLVIIFGFDVIPLGIVSVILVFMQFLVVGNWCFLCLVTAVISLILIYWAYDEVWACIKFLWTVWRRTHSGRILWNTFWGRATNEAADIAVDMIRESRRARAQA